MLLSGWLQETLRFYPTVPSTDRVAPRDMYVGGHFIPKGTIFWINFYAMSHLASVYEDPEVFRPVSDILSYTVTAYMCVCGVGSLQQLSAYGVVLHMGCR